MTGLFAHIALGLGVGLALGFFQFATLKHVVRLYLAGGSPLRAAALHLGRLALVAGLLVGLALIGAAALVAGAFGLILSREIVLRPVRKER